MNVRTKHYAFLVIIVLLALFFSSVSAASGETVIYFFKMKGCPHCADEEPFLEKLQEKYPSLVHHSRENKAQNSRQISELNLEESFPAALVGATFLIAPGITLADLPCTAGFPVVWTGILNAQGVSSSTFAILFIIYMVIYFPLSSYIRRSASLSASSTSLFWRGLQ